MNTINIVIKNIMYILPYIYCCYIWQKLWTRSIKFWFIIISFLPELTSLVSFKSSIHCDFISNRFSWFLEFYRNHKKIELFLTLSVFVSSLHNENIWQLLTKQLVDFDDFRICFRYRHFEQLFPMRVTPTRP